MIKNFNKVKKTVIFFGNEFFDAIPINNFYMKRNSFENIIQ